MTGEHVPPRSPGNERPVSLVVDPFDLNSVVRQVAEWDEGHVVSTLDAAFFSFTGRRPFDPVPHTVRIRPDHSGRE